MYILVLLLCGHPNTRTRANLNSRRGEPFVSRQVREGVHDPEVDKGGKPVSQDRID